MGKLGKRYLCGLAVLWLAACAAPTLPPVTETWPTATPVPPSATVVASATLAITPTPAATVTPRRYPTYTPRPTNTLTAAFVLDNNWNATAWLVNLPSRYGRWVGDNQIGIGNSFDGLLFDAYFDIESRTLITPTPWPEQSSPDFFRISSSPDKTHYIECTETALRLYLTDGQMLVGEVATPTYFGCYVVDWAKDSSKAVFVSAENKVFIWRVGEPKPNLVGLSAWMARWSPDGQRLLVVSGSQDADGATVDITSPTGELLLPKGFQIVAGNQWEPTRVSWFNDTVIENRRGGPTWSYNGFYSTISGKLIAEWYIESGIYQTFLMSPNRLWIVVDRYSGTTNLENQNSDGYYSLVDFLSGQEFRLTQIPNQFLDFITWSPDSSTFYTISRAVSETAQASAEVPFGLLALNPQTRTFTQLFPQAVFAQFNSTQTLAWVVFPAKREDGTLGLDGGVFDLAAGTLTARQYVTDKMVYGNPAFGDLVPAAWSSDGRRLVFADARGGLTLVNVNGETQTLTTTLPASAWPQDIRLEWSPDDANLLVQAGEQAWVVEVD